MIEATDTQQAVLIENLAEKIWTGYYDNFLPQEMTRRMLDNLQRAENILSGGEEYFLLYADNEPVGYCAFKDEGEKFYISKLYLLEEYRGKGLVKFMIGGYIKTHPDKHYRSCYLYCNAYSAASLASYNRLGFVIKDEISREFYGYKTKDYMLEKELEL